MRVIKTTSEVLTKLFGEVEFNTWDIEHNGNWLEVRPHKNPALFKVECLLSEFNESINNEVAFKEAYENYFEEI